MASSPRSSRLPQILVLLVGCVALARAAPAGMLKNQYVFDTPFLYDSFVWGADVFVHYTAEPARTRSLGYGDRVRLRVTRLAGENDPDRSDTLMISARVGSGDLPLVLDWLLAVDPFFGTGDSTRVSTFVHFLDARFTRARVDSAATSFLVKLVEADSSFVLRGSRRERTIRRALADYREGRAEEAVQALRSATEKEGLPVLARCVLTGALAETGRCTAYARESAALARAGIGREQPESVLVAQCWRPFSRRASESEYFRATELMNEDWMGPHQDGEWFGGDQVFLEARVVAVRDSAATNGQPPVVTLEVERILRGETRGRRLAVKWPGYMAPEWCGTGLEEKIRSWNAEPRRGPAVGARFVLGISRAEDGGWSSDPLLRWTPAEADEQGVREKILAFTPQVEERQRRERPAKDAARRAAEAKRAEEEAALVQTERARLDEERAVRAHANVEELARSSDAIVLARAPAASSPRGPWGRFAVVTPREWLRRPAQTGEHPDRLDVLFGAREDSLRARWLAMPPDNRPGSAVGDSVDCVAFLRYARNASLAFERELLFRPADAIAGFLWADSTVLRRVRIALQSRGAAPTEPDAACGASLAEFSHLDSAEVEGVVLKLSSVARPSGWGEPGTLILSCAEGPIPNAGWFTPCTIPDAAYRLDYAMDARSERITRERMRTLLDSLRTVPEIARGRVDSADPWTLSLRRILRGKERIFETTLNESASQTLSRRMAEIFAQPGPARESLKAFWAFAAGSTVSAWNLTPVLPVTPDSVRFLPAPPAPQPGTGTVVGLVVDGATELPVFLATVRATEPDRVIRTDEIGGFALRDLPPGLRWVQFYGPGFQPQVQRVDLIADSITTAVLRFGPERPNRYALRKGRIPQGLALRFSTNPSWTVRVRDDRGRPISGAYAALADSGRLRAGLADSTGALEFERPPDSDRWVLVRSPDRDPFRARVRFELATAGTLFVRMRKR